MEHDDITETDRHLEHTLSPEALQATGQAKSLPGVMAFTPWARPRRAADVHVLEVFTRCSVRTWGQLKDRQRVPWEGPGLVFFDRGALPLPTPGISGGHGIGTVC